MPDGYLISVGVKADFSELKAEQKAAQDAVKQAADNMKAAYAEFGQAAEKGSIQAIEALKLYETELGQAQARAVSAGAAMAGAQASVGAAVSHTVPQMAAASSAIRELEGNFSHNIRAAERFLTTTLGLGPALQAAFPVIGALALGGVLVEIGKSAYNLYEKFISLDAVSNKLLEDFKKMQEADFINVRSIETATARLDQATRSATNLGLAAKALHDISLAGVFGDVLSGNAGALATDIGGMRGANSLAQGGATDTKESIALTLKQTELQHEINNAKIEAAHASDAALTPEQRITAELQKRRALAKEEEAYTRRREQLLGNSTPSTSGDELRKLQDEKAEREAAAKLSELAKQERGRNALEMVHDEENAAKEKKRIIEEVTADGARGLKEDEEEQKRAHEEEIRQQREAATAYKEKIRLIEEVTRARMADAEDSINQKEGDVKAKASEGLLNPKQEADQLSGLVAQKLQIENAYYQQLEALYVTDSLEWQKLEDQRLTAVRKSADEQARIQTDLQKKQLRSYQQITDTVNREFLSTFDSILRGQVSIGRGAEQMASRMLLSFTNAMVQEALRHAQTKEIELLREAAHWIRVNVLHTQSKATETAVDASAAATKMAQAIATNLAVAMSNAAVAATGAYAATAMIPIVGPELAPAAAGASYAGAMAFASMASASGGWDRVPSDMVAQIHKDEMVMSAPLANKVRNMTDRPSTSIHYAPTIHGAGNDKEIMRSLKGHKKDLADIIKRAARNGHF